MKRSRSESAGSSSSSSGFASPAVIDHAGPHRHHCCMLLPPLASFFAAVSLRWHAPVRASQVHHSPSCSRLGSDSFTRSVRVDYGFMVTVADSICLSCLFCIVLISTSMNGLFFLLSFPSFILLVVSGFNFFVFLFAVWIFLFAHVLRKLFIVSFGISAILEKQLLI